jgi:hypothetical protein
MGRTSRYPFVTKGEAPEPPLCRPVRGSFRPSTPPRCAMLRVTLAWDIEGYSPFSSLSWEEPSKSSAVPFGWIEVLFTHLQDPVGWVGAVCVMGSIHDTHCGHAELAVGSGESEVGSSALNTLDCIKERSDLEPLADMSIWWSREETWNACPEPGSRKRDDDPKNEARKSPPEPTAGSGGERFALPPLFLATLG